MVPEKLYKYYSACTGISVLKSGKMRWSNPGLFNDPFEFQARPCFDGPYESDYKDLIRSLIDFAFDGLPTLYDSSKFCKDFVAHLDILIKSGMCRTEIQKEFESVVPPQMGFEREIISDWVNSWRDTSRILCLSEIGDCPLMWGHYSDGHRGCVLEMQHCPSLDTPLLAAKPVKYTDEYPTLGRIRDYLINGHSKDYRKMIFDAICFTKSTKWKYEKEWRALTFRSEYPNLGYGDYAMSPNELCGVTFGCKMSNSDEVCIRSILSDKYPKAKIRRAVISNSRYELSLVDI